MDWTIQSIESRETLNIYSTDSETWVVNAITRCWADYASSLRVTVVDPTNVAGWPVSHAMRSFIDAPCDVSGIENTATGEKMSTILRTWWQPTLWYPWCTWSLHVCHRRHHAHRRRNGK